MEPKWSITDFDIEKWRKFVKTVKNTKKVKERIEKNVKRKRIILSKKKIWYVIVGCQITTQQRSDEGSKVDLFLKSKSFVHNFDRYKKTKSKITAVKNELVTYGIGKNKQISEYLKEIYDLLEGGDWVILIESLKSLKKNTTIRKERETAKYVTRYKGLGNKQSRNFLQWLGVSKFEIPIDSRVTNKMKKMVCEFVPSPSALQDISTYLFLENSLQIISKKLYIHPCVLDACMFIEND
ncbi:MAG: hypothetical protein GKR91_06015 [Pseudomonadales bacterium]|nr:hypothetical protein [Pseudomonadales bacterium]